MPKDKYKYAKIDGRKRRVNVAEQAKFNNNGPVIPGSQVPAVTDLMVGVPQTYKQPQLVRTTREFLYDNGETSIEVRTHTKRGN